MRINTPLLITLLLLFSLNFLWATKSAEMYPGTLEKYGLRVSDLSHRERDITSDPTMRLAIKTDEATGFAYQVTDSRRRALFKGTFRYDVDDKSEAWALIHFPERGKYYVTVYILDRGYKQLLFYSVDSSGGFKDLVQPVYTGEGFREFGFTRDDLPFNELLITTDKPLKLSLQNETFLKYHVTVTDMNREPEIISRGLNPNVKVITRYRGVSDADLYLFLAKEGYYIVSITGTEMLQRREGLIARYVVHVKGDVDIGNAVSLAYGDPESVPDLSWYKYDTRPDFSELDEYVKATPLELRNTPEELAQYLGRKAETELEKARALYVWLQYFIRYDKEMEAQRNLTSDLWVYRTSYQGLLERRYAICSGYAKLFVLLGRLMDLEVVHITGKLGDNPNGHAWNAVKVDGRWRLVDATGQPEGRIVNEYTFIRHPAEFVKNRIPDDDFWRLMPWKP